MSANSNNNRQPLDRPIVARPIAARRDFLKTVGLTGAAFMLGLSRSNAGTVLNVAAEPAARFDALCHYRKIGQDYHHESDSRDWAGVVSVAARARG